jgi:hypothetical protein
VLVTRCDRKGTCDGDDCSSSKIMDQLFNIFFGEFKKERIRIEQKADKAWAIKEDGTRLPVSTIILDDVVKSVLNQAGKYKDTEFNFEGISGKNDNQKEVKLDSDISFQRKGEQWVPTTFNAYVVNTDRFERNFKLNYQQTVVGATSDIAINLPQLYSRPATTIDSKWISEREATLQSKYGEMPGMLFKIGDGRKSVDFGTSERSPNVDYVNGTKRVIHLRVSLDKAPICDYSLFVDGKLYERRKTGGGIFVRHDCRVDSFVMPGEKYRIATSSPVLTWNEFRE